MTNPRLTVRLRSLCFALLSFVALTFTPRARATIRYTVSLAAPERHTFHVTMQVPSVGRTLTVAMPAWNATYDIRDFAYRVTEVHATDASGTPLHAEKLDKQTWEISNPSQAPPQNLGTVTIQYDDYWNDPGPFSSQLNSHHAFLNLAEVLLYIPSARGEESEVTYSNLPVSWRVAQELPAGASPNNFVAVNYDALVDAPAEIGAYQEFSFDADKAHYRVVVDGKDWDEKSLRDALQRIVAYETSMMRDVPFKEYTFFFHFGSFTEAGGGGMEHSNCTAIAVPSGDVAASVAAHEFFHLWNVKRIRPQSLQPVDYPKEMWTRALWFAEGVTSTCAAFTLVRSGLWSPEQFYSDLAQQFTTLEMRPAHLWQSAEESSLDTWLDKYDYYDQPDVSISYYNKGQILGVLLDLAIRDATDNRKSLDDVMRSMNDDYARRGKFYNDSLGVEQEVKKISGHSFHDFFANYIAGTSEIPYNDFLRVAGLQAQVQQRTVAALGFETARAPGGGVQVASVESGSGAEKAGVKSGDLILQLNGQPFGRSAFRFLSQHQPGETATVRIQRNGAESDISFPLAQRAVQTYLISEIPSPTDRQKGILEGILRGTSN